MERSMVKPRKPSNIRGDDRPLLRKFDPVYWSEHRSALDYLSHLLVEGGRLGVDMINVRRSTTNSVITDLLDWFESTSNRGFEQLYSFLHIDGETMKPRLDRDPYAKPRIEITASITKKDNLSVVWHPGGWRESAIDFRLRRDTSNQISQRLWRRPPDFWWFTGDESPYFDSRASNELMYIRGVGNLYPKPVEEYGYYAEFNHDVVDGILICAVRAAYEGLIKRLELNFDVTPITSFDFDTREEPSEDAFLHSVKRVTAWRIENTVQLHQRQEKAKADARFAKASEDLLIATAALNLSAEIVSNALMRASENFKGSDATLDKHTAKLLRADGHSVDEKDVRNIRRLLQICRVDLVPEHLRPAPPKATAPPDNVVPLK